MPGEVLIISSAEDTHAVAVKQTIELELGGTAHIWNFGSFPAETSTLTHEAGGASVFLLGGHDLSGFRSVWWRRPDGFRISERITDDHVRDFCLREARRFLNGAFLASHPRLVNHPIRQSQADYKPYQLKVARDAGLRIPRTVMSNDPDAVRRFVETAAGDCIYKTFGPYPTYVFETRRLRPDDLSELERLRHAPLIVQEEVSRRVDLRINVFGSELFAAELAPDGDLAEIDWRMDSTNQWQAHQLPEQVETGVRRVVTTLGLDYGCIDMRLTPEGDYVFFEINPAGQFLFVEIDTGQPLCLALGRLLMEGSTPAAHRARRSAVDEVWLG